MLRGPVIALAAAVLLLPAAARPADATQVTLTVTATAGGSVTSAPTGISGCTSAGGTCSAAFETGSAVDVVLTATADDGYVLTSWTGCTSSDGGTCTVALAAGATEPVAVGVAFVQSATLTVTTTGSGTVTSDPGGIDCGSTCAAGFPDGSPVTLTATPAAGSVFSGWSGACESSGSSPTCTLTVAGATGVGAAFEPRLHTVTVILAGSGGGSVTSTPAGIDCGPTCSAAFAEGTTVTLTAAAAGGSAFAGWSGDCSGTDPSCSLSSLAAAKTAVADFVLGSSTLTVTRSGSGSVTSDPAGIDCGTSCSYPFPNGTAVTLTASPTAPDTFTGWTGACSGSDPTCTVTLADATTVGATFSGAVARTLTVSRGGGGSGRVTSSPAGIDCGSACSALFDDGTTVTLTAAASTGSSFTGWSGACSGSSPTCSVTLNAAATVGATFAPLSQLTVTRTGLGSGTVTSSPAGIACGLACTAAFATGTAVTLTARPSAGSTFTGWGGACKGSSTTCTLTLGSSQSVTAGFGGSAASVRVAVTTAGSGTVASAPPGISCGSICTASFPASSTGTVTLTAAPAAGWTFGGWGGACAGTAARCSLPLTGDASVSATFVAPPAAPISTGSPGTAAVASLRRVTVDTAATGKRSVVVQFAAVVPVTVTATVSKGSASVAHALVTVKRGAWKFRVALPARAAGALKVKLVAKAADGSSTTLAAAVRASPVARLRSVTAKRPAIVVRLQVAAAATAQATATVGKHRIASTKAALETGTRVLRLRVPAAVRGTVRVVVSLADAKGNTQAIARSVRLR